MTRNLHYFYPENDLALASDRPRYTAPGNVVRLRIAGATLPMWYGEPGDCFIASGVNAAWYNKINGLFGCSISPYNHRSDDTIALPWGWSKPSRQAYLDINFPASQLPDDARLDYIRQLSHRRTAAHAAALLAERLPFAVAPVPMELKTAEAIRSFVEAHPQGVILKLPWSSSGRGLVAVDSSMIDRQMPMLEGMLNRQGSVMAEPRYNKTADFAMLFAIGEGGKCTFEGYSLFNTERLGSYTGNILAPQAELRATIARTCPEAQLDAVREALIPILEEIAADYRGRLGVDMMTVESADGYCLVPVVEINFRVTMGHLCRIFYDRYVVEGARGTFSVRPASPEEPSGRMDVQMTGSRMSAGVLDLAQPGSDFSFLVELK